MASNGIRFTRVEVGGLLLPVGFRLHPTEEELISHYLKLKLRGKDSQVSDAIREINICNYEPWELPEKSLIKSDDEWYFYNRPIYKNNGRNEIERATVEGFWKITGQDKAVKDRDNKTIGKKRILTFRKGRGRSATITNWVMHEFYSLNANQRDFVLCHVKKKPGKNTDVATGDEGESSNYNNAPGFENQPQPAHTMDVEEFIMQEHNQPPQNLDLFSRHRDNLLAHGSNDYYGTQSAPGANDYHGMDENSVDFVDGLLVDDPYQGYSEEITHENVVNYFTLAQPPRKLYLEDCGVSSDSDAQVQHVVEQLQASSNHSRREEGVMLRNQNLRQAASSINVLPKPRTDRLQSVSDEDSSTHQITSRLRRASRPINALKLKSASSVDVDAVSLQINSVQLDCNEYYNNERTRRRTYPTSALVELGNPNELEQQQSKVKEAAERRAAVDFLPERNLISETNKDAEEGNKAEKGLKQTHNASTAGNWMSCSFISWETYPPLTSPPSVYLFNTVIGAILFCFFARYFSFFLSREVVLYGQWC